MICIAFVVSGRAGEVKKKAGLSIIHIPVPVAVRGKPLPIVAFVKGETTSAVLQFRSSKDARQSSIRMKSLGKGKFHATISAKTMATSTRLLYRIEATGRGTLTKRTIWYPVEIKALKDKTKPPKKKPGKVRKFIRKHPVVSTTGATAAVGGGVAAGVAAGSDQDPNYFSGVIVPPPVGTIDVTGTWLYTNPMDYGETITGKFKLVQSGTSVAGTFTEDGYSGGNLTGTITGNAISMALYFDHDGEEDRVSGTVLGNTMSGTWIELDTEDDDGGHGTFTATR